MSWAFGADREGGGSAAELAPPGAARHSTGPRAGRLTATDSAAFGPGFTRLGGAGPGLLLRGRRSGAGCTKPLSMAE